MGEVSIYQVDGFSDAGQCPASRLSVALTMVKNGFKVHALDIAICLLFIAAFSVLAFGAHALILSSFVPNFITFAFFEEIARACALCVIAREVAAPIKPSAVKIGIAFGALEISNAFFPERYASIEAQTSPFALLAAFEFGFGFLLHAALALLMLWIRRRAGWAPAIIATIVVHVGWNVLLSL
ncbi:hypothetical protein F1654_11495 [Alkalicaulis satelles]|uniref:PrsW family intramembrane metalloprotease n=1 Tax=Alkalicaulis satelles TaxID=2609175 RepID=A0A5M6ZCK4_9PROT|nr:hypothetical protein [Alkalicaulis satelles]KAA5802436.1 hypothetical protein F1654_11495 [Alkalicaulis satelles]